MTTAIPHGNATLKRAGVAVMIVGAVLFLLPAPRPDPFATVHELVQMTIRHYSWQCVGMGVYTLGNTLRLIGKQGHPGIPLPRKGPPIELVAAVQLRRRAWQNRAAALSGATSPAEQDRWRLRVAARRAARLRGVPLPRALVDRRVREAPAFAG